MVFQIFPFQICYYDQIQSSIPKGCYNPKKSPSVSGCSSEIKFSWGSSSSAYVDIPSKRNQTPETSYIPKICCMLGSGHFHNQAHRAVHYAFYTIVRDTRVCRQQPHNLVRNSHTTALLDKSCEFKLNKGAVIPDILLTLLLQLQTIAEELAGALTGFHALRP